jgi:hypothetical protein
MNQVLKTSLIEAAETKSKHASRQIFSSQEEGSLARYLCQASAMNFVLT